MSHSIRVCSWFDRKLFTRSNPGKIRCRPKVLNVFGGKRSASSSSNRFHGPYLHDACNRSVHWHCFKAVSYCRKLSKIMIDPCYSVRLIAVHRLCLSAAKDPSSKFNFTNKAVGVLPTFMFSNRVTFHCLSSCPFAQAR